MNIAVVTDDKVCRVGERFYTAAGYDWRGVADQFGSDLDHLTVHCRIFDRDVPPAGWDEVTTGANVSVAALPWFHKYEIFLRIPRAIFRLLRVVREADLVFLIVPSVYPTLAYVLARILRVPVLAWCVGDAQEVALLVYDELPIRLTYRLYAAVTRRIARKADVSVVASRHLARKYGVEGRAVVAYRSFTDPAAVAVDRGGRTGAGSTILTLARLSPEKGMDTLLRAMVAVLTEVPEARLVIAGDGPQREDLEALAGALGISSAVAFRGWVPRGPRLRAILSDADLFCLPSYTEGMPAALIEAMWASLPCVVTDVGDMGVVVGEAGAGRVVPARDSGSLARALVDLLSDRGAYDAAADRARATADSLSFENQTGRVAAAALGVARDRRSRAS